MGALVLVATLAGCGRPDADAPDPDRPFRLRFEDAPAPDAFSLEAPAVRDRAGGAEGLWAIVPGLPRPERARLVNPATGAEAVVSLFAGGAGPIRVSNAAADALGIGADPVPVRVTALRSRPALDTTGSRF
jgi:hypothetical protein